MNDPKKQQLKQMSKQYIQQEQKLIQKKYPLQLNTSLEKITEIRDVPLNINDIKNSLSAYDEQQEMKFKKSQNILNFQQQEDEKTKAQKNYIKIINNTKQQRSLSLQNHNKKEKPKKFYRNLNKIKERLNQMNVQKKIADQTLECVKDNKYFFVDFGEKGQEQLKLMENQYEVEAINRVVGLPYVSKQSNMNLEYIGKERYYKRVQSKTIQKCQDKLQQYKSQKINEEEWKKQKEQDKILKKLNKQKTKKEKSPQQQQKQLPKEKTSKSLSRRIKQESNSKSLNNSIQMTQERPLFQIQSPKTEQNSINQLSSPKNNENFSENQSQQYEQLDQYKSQDLQDQNIDINQSEIHLPKINQNNDYQQQKLNGESIDAMSKSYIESKQQQQENGKGIQNLSKTDVQQSSGIGLITTKSGRSSSLLKEAVMKDLKDRHLKGELTLQEMRFRKWQKIEEEEKRRHHLLEVRRRQKNLLKFEFDRSSQNISRISQQIFQTNLEQHGQIYKVQENIRKQQKNLISQFYQAKAPQRMVQQLKQDFGKIVSNLDLLANQKE